MENRVSNDNPRIMNSNRKETMLTERFYELSYISLIFNIIICARYTNNGVKNLLISLEGRFIYHYVLKWNAVLVHVISQLLCYVLTIVG